MLNRYGIQARAVTSVILLLHLLLLSVARQEDTDVVLNPTLEEEAEQTRRRSISDEQSSQLSRSGYFFDHVSGAIRLAFHHKRSIQEWENDEEDNDRVGSTAEDRSKAAFASDDSPLEEDFRSQPGELTYTDHFQLRLGGFGSDQQLHAT